MAVIAHPRCSEGTALFVYWALEPARHYWVLKRRKPFTRPSEDIWPVLMRIEERMRKQQFVGDPIEFNLARFLGRPFAEEARRNPGAYSIPEFMRTDVSGAQVE
jgi:hypothetical protein